MSVCVEVKFGSSSSKHFSLRDLAISSTLVLYLTGCMIDAISPNHIKIKKTNIIGM